MEFGDGSLLSALDLTFRREGGREERGERERRGGDLLNCKMRNN